MIGIRENELRDALLAIGLQRPLREIAKALTERGILTVRGKAWDAMGVSRLIKRLGGLTHGIHVAPSVDVDGLPPIDPASIDLVLTAPPEPKIRGRKGKSISERDYPTYTTSWMRQIRPLLKDTGNVIIILKPVLFGNQLSDYILRTRLALRADKWIERGEFVFSALKTRKSYDELVSFQAHVLWYSATDRARQHVSGHVLAKDMPLDLEFAKYFLDNKGKNTLVYPYSIIGNLIEMFSPHGGIVTDPFAVGHYTVPAAARILKRRFVALGSTDKFAIEAFNRQDILRSLTDSPNPSSRHAAPEAGLEPVELSPPISRRRSA